ncbi:uncharacterized protein G2W53_039551 [Senna tora]|uniref:Uncharacterized protein n=1 Tax=Senna tora TaxID=362788 RepID=A0A834SR07_9FABA|nr:uncharacterized protein G2W53_039551 [Senna tora]
MSLRSRTLGTSCHRGSQFVTQERVTFVVLDSAYWCNQENLQDVEKRIREEVRQEMQKEMQDMKKQIMEQLLVSYGMSIPSPPSQPLVRSIGSSTLPNKDL